MDIIVDGWACLRVAEPPVSGRRTQDGTVALRPPDLGMSHRPGARGELETHHVCLCASTLRINLVCCSCCWFFEFSNTSQIRNNNGPALKSLHSRHLFVFLFVVIFKHITHWTFKQLNLCCLGLFTILLLPLVFSEALVLVWVLVLLLIYVVVICLGR